MVESNVDIRSVIIGFVYVVDIIVNPVERLGRLFLDDVVVTSAKPEVIDNVVLARKVSVVDCTRVSVMVL